MTSIIQGLTAPLPHYSGTCGASGDGTVQQGPAPASILRPSPKRPSETALRALATEAPPPRKRVRFSIDETTKVSDDPVQRLTGGNIILSLQHCGFQQIQVDEKDLISAQHTAGGLTFTTLLRLPTGDSIDLLKITTFFPGTVKKEEASLIGSMLLRWNSEIDLPGFCLIEKPTTRVVTYRLVIPCADHTIDKRILRAYLRAIRLACDTYGPSLASQADGQ